MPCCMHNMMLIQRRTSFLAIRQHKLTICTRTSCSLSPSHPSRRWLHAECLHGVVDTGASSPKAATIFPQPIALAASFNSGLAKRVRPSPAPVLHICHYCLMMLLCMPLPKLARMVLCSTLSIRQYDVLCCPSVSAACRMGCYCSAISAGSPPACAAHLSSHLPMNKQLLTCSRCAGRCCHQRRGSRHVQHAAEGGWHHQVPCHCHSLYSRARSSACS